MPQGIHSHMGEIIGFDQNEIEVKYGKGIEMYLKGSKMAQLIKALVSMPDDLSSVLGVMSSAKSFFDDPPPPHTLWVTRTLMNK